MALNFFSNWVTSLPFPTLTAPNKETDLRVGARRTMGSLSSGGTHMVALEPCCWKWHSSKLHRSMSSLLARLSRFFKSPLLFEIRTGNDRAWFSQPKLQLMKQPLTLTRSQNHSLRFGDMVRQKFPVPKVLSIPKLTWGSPKISIHDLQSFGSQPLRPPRSFVVLQTTEPTAFKASNPSVNGCRMMTEYLAYFITRHALRNEQHPVQTVIIPRLFRTKDLVPQGDLHDFSIGNLQTSHSRVPPSLHNNTRGMTRTQ